MPATPIKLAGTVSGRESPSAESFIPTLPISSPSKEVKSFPASKSKSMPTLPIVRPSREVRASPSNSKDMPTFSKRVFVKLSRMSLSSISTDIPTEPISKESVSKASFPSMSKFIPTLLKLSSEMDFTFALSSTTKDMPTFSKLGRLTSVNFLLLSIANLSSTSARFSNPERSSSFDASSMKREPFLTCLRFLSGLSVVTSSPPIVIFL
mmetsp:Transcript_7555/g.20605  ORF Transcript_7555/g.20605 Transcript_7555/m.20605 type:complete len:209 (+) Transcript_7555:417-1043(+)